MWCSLLDYEVMLNLRDYIRLRGDMRDVLVQQCICQWYISILVESKRDVWSSLSGREMCEGV